MSDIRPGAKAIAFKRTSRVLAQCMQVLGWFLLAAAGIALIGSLITALLPSDILGRLREGQAGKRLKILDSEFELPPGTPHKPIVLSILLTILPMCVWTGAVSLLIAGILGLVGAGRPFDNSNARRLSWLAVLAALEPLMEMAAGLAGKGVLAAALGLHSSIAVSGNVSWSLVLLLLLVLSGVFRYGAELQSDVDATV